MRRPRKRTEQFGYVEGPKDGSYYLRYWTEPDNGEPRVRRAVEVGTKNQFRDREEANLSVEAAVLRRRINAGVLGRTMGQLIALFERDEMPKRSNTRATVQACLDHCKDWSEEPVAELADPTQSKRLEGWLNGLRSRPHSKSGDIGLSTGTKKRVKNQMGRLFEFAMRCGYIPSTINPMKFVRLVSGEDPKRRQTLEAGEMWAFFDDPTIPAHIKAMAHVARLTGLRISEILGLKDEDFDLDNMLLTVSRRVDGNNVDRPKSKKSGEPIPLSQELYGIIAKWLESPEFVASPEKWFFASPYTKLPWDGNGLQRFWLAPWGKTHGIEKFGWHTFRHTFKQNLEDSRVPAEVIQRLMRHSSYQVTAGYGTGINYDRLREGQEKAAPVKGTPQLIAKKKRWA